jgi:16S rRNA (guanine(966)-N(2))-methyltransferase RsmD
MRIVGGKFKGRKFYPPAKKWPTRPTTDFSKEALFNILENRIDFSETKMLDLFGGTGNHCYEFISRGCQDATYVDRHGPCIKFVNSLAKELEISNYVSIVKADVKKFIKSSLHQYDFIFAGPPYPLPWLDEIPTLIFKNNLLKKSGLFVLEHNPDHNFEGMPEFDELRSYGQTKFSFFSH